MSRELSGEQALFEAARRIEGAAARAAYLDQACCGDTALRERVGKLLEALKGDAAFLESPPAAVAGAAAAARRATLPAPLLGFLSPGDDPATLGRLGHYNFLETIGSGGFGVVLKARDEKLQRIVAVKTLAEPLAASGTARQRFVREAIAAAAVRHENVVAIHAVDDEGIVPFLVMEFIDGQSLEAKLREVGCLELKEILRIGLQIAAGLAAAHKQGVIHRDVKPANILLENGVQRVKITDFGLARAAGDAAITATELIAGTPAYMSPEQARGDAVDFRSDLFSLGSVLYAMCTGQAPFRGSTTIGVIKRVCEEAPQPIRDLNADIPEWLDAVVQRLHAKQPAERFQSASEVAEALAQRLAQLQQPTGSESGLGMLNRKSVDASDSRSPLRTPHSAMGGRWLLPAVAAGVLLACTLALTEAGGLTQLVPTVIRIVTGEGTLLVETTDPNVKVTIEGDGGFSITGAGPQEIRMRPGSYRVKAVKDGRALTLDREIVRISRGGSVIVKVTAEGAPSAPGVAAGAASEHPFVILASAGRAARAFATLAEAVAAAGDGDTIEIRADGPFVAEPIVVSRRLVIRAAEGAKPQFLARARGPGFIVHFISAHAPLTLEGLDYRETRGEEFAFLFVHARAAPLRVANCRFERRHAGGLIQALRAPVEIRNSLLIDGDFNAALQGQARWEDDKAMHLENNVFVSPARAVLQSVPRDVRGYTYVLRGNTFVTGTPFGFGLPLPATSSSGPDAAAAPQRIRVHASENVFAASSALFATNLLTPPTQAALPQLSAGDIDRIWQGLLAWREQRNLYPGGLRFRVLEHLGKPLAGQTEIRTLKDWLALWEATDTGSLQGPILFLGGDVARASLAPSASLRPDDFRLQEGSAGRGAAADGGDLGANMDLVGPGAAYERWKRTPEYQAWLAQVNRLRTSSGQGALPPQPAPGAAPPDIEAVLADAELIYTFEPDTLYESEGRRHVRDLSAHGRHGWLHNAAQTGGIAGGGIDCTAGAVIVPERLLNDCPEYTVALWFQRSGGGLAKPYNEFAQAFDADETGRNGGLHFLAVTEERQARVSAWNRAKGGDPWWHSSTPADVWPPDEWALFAATLRGGGAERGVVQIRVNEAKRLLPAQSVNSLSAGHVMLGRSRMTNEVGGLLDEVAVFRRALTDAELDVLYRHVRAGRPLAGHKPLESREASPLADAPCASQPGGQSVDSPTMP
jgi:serine/threonine protein kinase